MSGHSKWSTIKRQKGVADQKRGQLFTKLSKAISFAVKEGGNITDPAMNFKLRLAIDAAKTANMPKENIDRAIQRAVGKEAGDMQELVYEGFGPGGFSVIVETVTDNKQRTVSEVKNVFDKNGGSIGSPGSVSYQFVKKGLITVLKEGKSLDDIFLLAAEAGAEDVEEGEDEVYVYTQPDELGKVKESLTQLELSVTQNELVWKPTLFTMLRDQESVDKAVTFLEKLEDLDDVQKVYANYEEQDMAETNG